MADRWHLSEDATGLILSRRRPARFDVSATTRLPPVAQPARLAHQVRQDLWRALRRVPGFAPVVAIRKESRMLAITAGGELKRACNLSAVTETIQNVLDNPDFRMRWIRCAGRLDTEIRTSAEEAQP